jgi:glycosyltransferase involved in cell wall biosynthesis
MTGQFNGFLNPYDVLWKTFRLPPPSTAVIIPIHNEVQYLPYSLKALAQAADGFNEIHFVIDGCTDCSEYLVRQFPAAAKIHHLPKHTWENRAAEAFQFGFDKAQAEILLAWAADLVMPNYMPALLRTDFADVLVGCMSYRYVNYGLTDLRLRIHGYWENLYKDLISLVRSTARHSGTYAVRASCLKELGGLRDVLSEYDDLEQRMTTSFDVGFNPATNITHLRPVLTKAKQLNQGRARARYGSGLVSTLLHSVIHLKPYVLTGYMQERRMRQQQTDEDLKEWIFEGLRHQFPRLEKDGSR